jgi:hypothetical protein
MALRGHNMTVASVEATVRYLICTCGPCLLAFPADWIRGILTEEEAGSSETVSSAGVAYAVTSLADQLQISSGARSVDARLVLCGNGTCTRAFIVDRVVELIDVDQAAFRPLPGHFRGSERAKLSGCLLYEDTMVVVVNPVWLLDSDTRTERSPLRTALPQHETSGLSRAHVPAAQSAVG